MATAAERRHGQGMPQPKSIRRLPLRNGAAVLVRQAVASDTELVRAAFDRPTSGSHCRRFSAPVHRLSDGARRHPDERDEALIAMDPDSKEAVGIVRFIRTRRERVAGVAIADDWQNTGLGTALLEQLAVSSPMSGGAEGDARLPDGTGELQRAAGALVQRARSAQTERSLLGVVAEVEAGLDQLAVAMRLLSEAVVDWSVERRLTADLAALPPDALALYRDLRDSSHAIRAARDSCSRSVESRRPLEVPG
jgi:hypothetical protein